MGWIDDMLLVIGGACIKTHQPKMWYKGFGVRRLSLKSELETEQFTGLSLED
jgi:hypothetical protein